MNVCLLNNITYVRNEYTNTLKKIAKRTEKRTTEYPQTFIEYLFSSHHTHVYIYNKSQARLEMAEV